MQINIVEIAKAGKELGIELFVLDDGWFGKRDSDNSSEFPEVLFENCSSGGARFDPGMSYYMPQTWASDDTDAVERLKIQYGTSIVYPVSSIGSHASTIPNHQVSRMEKMETRGLTAMMGTFGYELDLTKFTNEEKETVKEQVKAY